MSNLSTVKLKSYSEKHAVLLEHMVDLRGFGVRHAVLGIALCLKVYNLFYIWVVRHKCLVHKKMMNLPFKQGKK